MQKKIIASLLVSPVAISAMADITVSGLPIDGWEPVSGAVTGGIVNGNKVTCPIGTGSITNVFAAPAPGKYKIVFNDLTNAGVTISSEYVDDSSIVVSDSGAVEFTVKDFDPETVKDGVAVTFTVTPVSAAAEFSFEQSPIAIVFDFADVDLSTATDDIPEFKDLIEQEEPSEKYNELVSQKAELESEKANLLKKVQDYPGEATAEDQDDAEQVATANENNLKTYVDYGLYEDPYGITDEINDLITKINALNTAIEAENDKYTALDRNTATKAQAQTAINGLNDKLTALTTLYNNVKTAFENANQKVDEGSLFDTKGTVPYTAAQTALTELQTSFDETFADLNDPTLEWDEDAVTAVGTKISEAETALNTLQTDLNNYNGFLSWFANTSGFEKEYNSARININGLQAIDGYIGLFDEWKAEQIALVNAQVTIVEDAKKPIVVGSTAAEIQAAETTIANAVTAIQGIKNAAVVLINGDGTDANIGQNALMTNALAKVQELTDALNEKTSGMTAEILKKLLPGTDAEKQAIIDGLNDAVKDVQNAIADVKTECEGKYATRTLSATDYADDAEKVVAVATAETALDNYITTNKLNEVQAAANKIAEVNAAIKKFEDDLDSFKEDTKPSEDKEGVNFPNLFAGNVKGFEAAKEALNVSNYSTDADKILAQITTTTGQASTIHNVVKTAANTAAAFTSALETLRDPYISDKSKWLLTGDDATFSIDDFEDKVTAEEDVAQGWSESYDSIVTLANKPNVKGEEVLTAANTLQKAMNAHPWADAMKTLFNELEDNGTKSNYAVVDAALTAVENNTNAPVAAEAATLRSALDQIKTSIDALDADDPDWILPADNSGDSSDSSDDSSTENLSETEGEGGDSGVTESDDTVNPAIALKAAAAIAIDEDLSDLMKKVKKYADAQTAYGTLKDNLKTVMDQITEDSDYCENSVSGDATMQYFSKIIGEAANVASQTFAYPTAENTLYAQYNGLVKKLDDYLKEGAIGGESAGNKTNEQSFAQNCTDVTTYAKAFYDDMVDNEQSLYALLDLSDSVRKILEGDLAQLSGNSKEEGVTNYDPEMPAVNKAYNKIKDLLDKDLKAADDGVANDYKVGKCSKNQSTLEEPYTTIKSKAKSIIDDLDTQYKPLVEAANAEIVDNSGVKAAIAKANSAYSAAIKVFNAYKSLTNPGYKAYVASQPNYRGHEELYSFATKIINITNGYESYVTQKNDALEVIDENEFVAKFVDPLINGVTVTEGGDTTGGDGEGDGDETTTPTTTNVPSYIAQIEALQVQIINDYNGWGASYFEKLSTQVSTNIADATTELGLLGLSESAADILEDASDALDSATKKYEEAEKLTPPAKSDEVGDGEEEGGTPSVGGSDDDDDADTVADVDT
ncbi:MAG: hypothetical protein K2K97_06790, partial [Muribaculaceae bacterium]|nr:hypothetical protein [Muribaculaceae bacterium]